MILSLGTQSPAVLAWQNALRAHGFEVVPDGIYGPATVAATKKMQGSLGVTADGVVGPQTLSAYNIRFNERILPEVAVTAGPQPPLIFFAAIAAVAVYALIKSRKG